LLGEPIIETIIGRGYRFIANMAETAGEGTPPERLEVLPMTAPSSGMAGEEPRSGVTVRHAQILEQVADALAASTAAAGVMVIVIDPGC
jgi:hypothetical protein